MAVSLVSALSLGLLIALTYQVTGAFWPSLAAPCLLVSFAAFEHSATRIYTDAPQLAFMLGRMVAFQRHLLSRSWRSLALAGVLMGLSVAVKYSSAPIIAVMGLFALLSAGSPLQRLARSALVGSLSVAVFVAVNPYLYTDPLARTLDIISDWGGLMERISQAPHWARDLVASSWHGLASVARRGMLAPAQSFTSLAAAPWLGLAALVAGAAALARYRVELRSVWQGRESPIGLGLAAAGPLGWALGSFGAWAWLFLVGTNALLWRAAGRGARDDGRRAVCAFFLASLFVACLATGAWLQLDWPRYSLRVPVLAPCVHVAGLVVLGSLLRWTRRGRAPLQA